MSDWRHPDDLEDDVEVYGLVRHASCNVVVLGWKDNGRFLARAQNGGVVVADDLIGWSPTYP